MFKFLFKKNTCDIWDNFFFHVITNFFLIVLLGLLYVVYIMISALGEVLMLKQMFSLLAVIVCCAVFFGVYFGYGKSNVDIANYEAPHYGTFFKNLFSEFKDGSLFGLLIGILYGVASVSIPFYLRMWKPEDGSTGSFLWAVIIFLMVWFLIISLIAFQWVLPVKAIMKNGIKKCIKKAYIITFDNLRISIQLFLLNIFNSILTVFLFGLMPSFSGIALTNINALRLLMYKYDWLEVNSDLTYQEQRDVPWDDLLKKDKKLVGKRPLKSFFMPWKEEEK